MSEQIIIAVITGVCGGGVISGVIAAVTNRRKTSAEAASIISEASQRALDTVRNDVIQPLREQIDYQEEQIKHLEGVQRKAFMMTRYTRELFHWLQSFCEIVEPDFLARHPKPRLPDELRPDIAPETIPGPPVSGGPNHTPTGEEGR